MPIDSVDRPLRFAIVASRAKCGEGGSSAGGMHIRPLTCRPQRSRQAARKASASRGGMPAFCGSSPVLTWTSSRGARPARTISRPSSIARLSRSTVSITSNSATASRALLDCSGPMRCSSTPLNCVRRAGHLALASCTRFSPKTRCPAASTGTMSSPGKVLETATSVTEPGSRPASASARRMAARTSARRETTSEGASVMVWRPPGPALTRAGNRVLVRAGRAAQAARSQLRVRIPDRRAQIRT